MFFAVLPAHVFIYKDVKCDVNSILQYMSNGMSSEHLWYLKVLFVIMVILFPICKIPVRYKFINVVVLLFLALKFASFAHLPAYSLVMNYSYYFLLGFAFPNIFNPCIKKISAKKYFDVSQNVLFIIVSAIMIFEQVRIQKSFETYYGAWNLSGHQNEYVFVSSITTIWLYLLVDFIVDRSIIEKLSHNKIIDLISQYSLFIYVYHILISGIVAKLFVDPIFDLLPHTFVVSAIRKVVGVIIMIGGPIGVKILLDFCELKVNYLYKK